MLKGLLGVAWMYWWLGSQESTKSSSMYIYSSSERQIAYIWAKNGQPDKELREAGNLQEHLEWIFLANAAIFKAKKDH